MIKMFKKELKKDEIKNRIEIIENEASKLSSNLNMKK